MSREIEKVGGQRKNLEAFDHPVFSYGLLYTIEFTEMSSSSR